MLAAASGVAIAAAAGLRAFLPLLALGLAARLGIVTLHAGAAWLSSDAALWALGVATVVEIVGDKVPVIDHALDALGTLLRPIAGGIGAYAALAHWPEPIALALALLLGAGSLGVHALKAKTRIGSTVMTLGHANPLLSLGEDAAALAMTAGAILVPIATLVLVLAVVAFVRGRRRDRPPGH